MPRVLDRLTASPRRLFMAVLLFVVLDLSILVINLWIAHQVALDAVAINLAGRQRMLSQRLTKAALLAAGDPASTQAQAARLEMIAAAQLFDSTLRAFQQGGPTIGGDGMPVTLYPVSTEAGRSALEAVITRWRTTDALRARLSNADDMAIAAFREFMVANNLALLDGMNRMTSALEQRSVDFTNSLRAIQTAAFALALINFLLILGSLLRQQRTAEQAQHRWQAAASKDPLTGLANRAAFNSALTQAIDHARQTGETLSVMMLDLDAFKPINDTYGHAVGDQVLQRFAACLLAAARHSDSVARLGGDEFVMLCPKLDKASRIDEVCQRILAEVAQISLPDYPEIHPATSIGVAVFPRDAEQAAALLQVADAAMYRSKREGGGRSVGQSSADH